jgi:hypothetical protein
VISKEYRSWSFADRSFLFAFTVSILWHLFWFFSVTIVVTPTKIKRAIETKTVSLGPVLSDTIFRTLVESRPEYSKTFYRQLADFEPATDIPTPTIERHASGDVMSLPVGKKFAQSLKDLIGGSKTLPEDAITDPLGFTGDSSFFELTGDISKNQILSRPATPEGFLPRALEIEFELAPDGKVVVLGTVLSSTDPAEDLRWENYFRQCLFMPAPVLGSSGSPKGKVTFKRSALGE